MKELFEKVIDLSEEGLKKNILVKQILEVDENLDKKTDEIHKKFYET